MTEVEALASIATALKWIANSLSFIGVMLMLMAILK